MPTNAESPTPIAPYHLQLIYASALRQTQNSHTAEDITQAALLLFLKKTKEGQAPPPRYLAAWLLKTTHYLVQESRREARRRQRRELRAASEEPRMHNAPPHHHPDIHDALDTALLKIPRLDRELIAQRYLQERPLPEIARTLHLSENSTTKRLSRALEKLRQALTRSGVSTAAPALILTLQQQAPIHPSLSFAPTLPSAAAQSLARHFIRRLTLIKLGTLAGALGTGFLIMLALIHTSPAPSLPQAPAPSFTSAQNTPWEFPSPINVTQTLESPSNKLLTDLLQNLALSRAALKTVSLQSTTTIEEWNPDQKIWNETGSIEGQGWIDLGYPRRFRSEIAREHLAWSGGTTPFLDSTFTESWDGQTLRTLYLPPYSNLHGDIGSKQSIASNRLICGINYSTQLSGEIQIGYFNEEEFLATFDPNVLSLQNLSAQRVMMNGIPSIQLTNNLATASTPHEAIQYWFDPNRGYALLASARTRDTAAPTEILVIIDQLAQPAPVIFYPLEVHELTRSKDPATQIQHFTRRHFLATKITANIPIDPSQFQLHFPPNIKVSSTQP